MEPATYSPDEPTRERTQTTPARSRTVLVDMATVQLVVGVLLILFGVLVLINAALLPWVAGFGLVAFGIWMLVKGGYLGRPRQELQPAEPPHWHP